MEIFEKKYWPTYIELGSGANGSVYSCLSRRNTNSFALKELKIDKMALREVELHFRCSICENVVNVFDVFKDWKSNKLSLLMERMDGRLFDKAREFSEYDEAKKANLMYQICNAVLFLHSNDIAHRDLKYENILIHDEGPNYKLKLSDFGFAKICKSNEMTLNTPCGTAGYMGPEFLKCQPYDKACDLWAFGVILYIILFYELPFKPCFTPNTMENIMNAKTRFIEQDNVTVSRDAKDLVKSLIVPNPKQRPTIEQVIESAWIKNRTSNQRTLINSRKFLTEDMNTWMENMSRSVKEKLEEMRNRKPARNDDENLGKYLDL